MPATSSDYKEISALSVCCGKMNSGTKLEHKNNNAKVTDFFTSIQHNGDKNKIHSQGHGVSVANGTHAPITSKVLSDSEHSKSGNNFSTCAINGLEKKPDSGVNTPCSMVMHLETTPSSVVTTRQDKDVLDSLATLSKVSPEIKSKEVSPSNAGKQKSARKSVSKAKVSYGKLPTYKFSLSNKSKPTWVELMHEAIVEIGDRTGSSIPAITKFIKHKREQFQSLPPNKFKNNLNIGLKAALKDKRFVKIKSSYKINSEWVKRKTQALRQKESARRIRETKRRKELEEKKKADQKRLDILKKEREKREEEQREMIEALKKAKLKQEQELKKEQDSMKDAEQLKKEEEKRKALEEERKIKQLEIVKAKALAEKIRKRKFPMDDVMLRAEDEALGVKAPEGTEKLPSLPYALEFCIPFDCENKKVAYPVASVSSTSVSEGSRGLVSDVLQIFNFFNGDVGFSRIFPGLVPEFTFSHLMYSVNEILLGNSKAARSLPPLINHLFLTSLKIIVGHDDVKDIVKLNDFDETNRKGELLPLRNDLIKLSKYLTSLSWADVLLSYMDMMHRFYTTDASIDTSVVPGFPLSSDLFSEIQGNAENPVDCSIDQMTENENEQALSHYHGYLGNPTGVLACAYDKLLKLDPWNLSAEELMALLRTLTDDILGSCSDLAQNISNRGEELYELLKAKKAAESTHRKVKLAHEGPKGRSKKPKQNDAAEDEKKDEKKDEKIDDSNGVKRENEEKDYVNKDTKAIKMIIESGNSKNTRDKDVTKSENKNSDEDGIAVKKEKAPFVPTATKKELEAAEKARQKATDNYEKGLKQLISKSEPIGMDRDFNRVFYFRHNPEVIMIETVNTSLEKHIEFVDHPLSCFSQSWHMIHTKSLFDEYVASLDIRGLREDELYDALMGTSGSSSLKRFMFDDTKKKNAGIARRREEEEFERRLQNAIIACAADEENTGRRSRRLASTAQEELEKIKVEMEIAAEMYEVACRPEPINYNELTGLDLMIDFESENLNDSTEVRHCSRLWQKDNTFPSGSVEVLIAEILNIEEMCNDLAPWSQSDINRECWIGNLKSIGKLWNRGNVLRLGPRDGMSGEGNVSPMEEDHEENQINPHSTYNSSGSKTNRKRRKRSVANKKSEKGPTSLHQLLKALKGALTDLEARLYSVTGLEMAEAAINKSNENSSVASMNNSNSSATKKEIVAWKKKIHGLKKLSGRSVQAIRESIVSAITCARKAKQTKALRGLREALHLCSPNTAVEARELALKLLADHGDYEPPIRNGDDDEDMDSVEEVITDEEQGDDSTKSFLCADAFMVNGCLDGDETSDRIDWKDALKECRTLSRFSSLAMSFVMKSKMLLEKHDEDRERLIDALNYWKMQGSRRRKSKVKKNPNYDSHTEIWAEVIPEERYILAKVKGYPWWPAITCKAKCSDISSKLESVGRTLISFIGEKHLYAVKDDEEIQPYIDDLEDNDLESYSSDIQKAYKKSTVMMKRILRTDTVK